METVSTESLREVELEVARGLLLGARRATHILNMDLSTRLAGHADVNSLGAEPAVVLKEVVVAAGGLLPGAAAVGADLQGGDGLVGVDDLHGEPVGGGAFLVLQGDGRLDAAGHEGPIDGDDAFRGAGELGEGGLEEVEVVGFTLGAFVNDLGG